MKIILFKWEIYASEKKYLFFTQISHNFSKKGLLTVIWAEDFQIFEKWFCQIFIFEQNCQPKSNCNCSIIRGGGGLFSTGKQTTFNSSEMFRRLHNIPLTKV